MYLQVWVQSWFYVLIFKVLWIILFLLSVVFEGCMKQRRQLKNSLATLLSKKADTDNELISLNERHKCYAVLRTKGGSGEMHTVRKLVDELLANKQENILICYLYEIDEAHYYTKYFDESCSTFLPSYHFIASGVSGLVNCNWTSKAALNKLIKALNRSDTDFSVIFTCGTSSASIAEIRKRFFAISNLCERVFISVNANAENSVLAARNLADWDETEFNNVSIAWWYSLVQGSHKLAHWKLFDIGITEDREVNNTALKPSEISLLERCKKLNS